MPALLPSSNLNLPVPSYLICTVEMTAAPASQGPCAGEMGKIQRERLSGVLASVLCMSALAVE